MSASMYNTKSPTIRRILREAAELSSSPSADYTATPLESNLFEWHFTLRGPPNSAFEDGIYHGRIILPPAYPHRPPSFRFVTPSGRFETNREICLSISGHHEETWQPAWGLRTALVALRSFMETNPQGQLGGLETTDAVRKTLAAKSQAWKCPACGKSNEAILAESSAAAEEMEAQDSAAAAAAPATAAAAGGDAAGTAGASSSPKKKTNEVVVPAELKMGWRDEMGGSKKDDAEPGGDAESAALAEGFVQTGGPERVSAEEGIRAAAAPLPARPAQGVPLPTRTVPLPDPAAPLPATLQQTQMQTQTFRRSTPPEDAVPLWVDRAIVILCVILAAMLLKFFCA